MSADFRLVTGLGKLHIGRPRPPGASRDASGTLRQINACSLESKTTPLAALYLPSARMYAKLISTSQEGRLQSTSSSPPCSLRYSGNGVITGQGWEVRRALTLICGGKQGLQGFPAKAVDLTILAGPLVLSQVLRRGSTQRATLLQRA